jgi:hypothetical protein
MRNFLETAASRTGAAVVSSIAILLALNGYIVRELFHTEYTAQMHSIEGTYMAISRVLVERPAALWSWWPYWFCGIPFANTYFPGMHIFDAAIARAAGISPALAYHFSCALLYSLGPVALFLLVWRTSQQWIPAFVAALAYELVSPSLWLIPEIVKDTGTPWNARRYQAMVAWGEGPHVAALTLIPIALLLLWRALEGRRRFLLPAAIAMGAAMLTSAFGMTTLALAGLCLVLAAPGDEWRGRAVRALALGIASYLLVSPLIPPSMLLDVQANSELVGAGYRRNLPNTLALIGVLAAALVVRSVGLRLRWPEPVRFFALFSTVFAGIPMLAYHARLYAIPQPQRYHLQAEMGLIPLAVLAGWAVIRRWPRELKVALALVLLACAAVQVRHYRRYAKWLNLGVDIRKTVEYRTARWLDANLPGQRVMASGSVDAWLNVFARNPQLHGGHDPMTPAPKVRHPVFAAYYGAPETAAWLRAFGVTALTVHGPASEEYWHPFRNPKAFEGVLPVLWRDGDDTIYAIPGSSGSLAHVVPVETVVPVEPGGGINRDALLRYVRALDDRHLPAATLTWAGPDDGRIVAHVPEGRVISLQSTFHRGWKATIGGRPVPTRADGLGLTVIDPGREARAAIDLHYDGGRERPFTWASSAAALAGLLAASRRRPRQV